MASPQAQIHTQLLKNDLNQKELDYYLGTDLIAVDCEMMGLNINRDRLCLVQITDRNRLVTLVQIAKGQTQAPLLKQLFESSKVVKIFHFARTDLCWLKYWLNITVENFFCTKIASKIARTYTDKHGLKDLCKELTGKDLNKNQQSSYWGNSEYTREQMDYAANDVVHLIPLYEYLNNILQREGKYELVKTCCSFIPTMVELDYHGYQGVLEH